MTLHSRPVALIPARGGSKGVPLKNIRKLGDQPLLAWTIRAAQASGVFEKIFVSTDHSEIATVARNWGAEVIGRPAEHATDHSPVIDTIRYAIHWLGEQGLAPEIMIMMEPTCPFRSAATIRQCYETLIDPKRALDSVATFQAAKVNPWRTWTIQDGHPDHFIPGSNPWLPRQKLPEAFQLNGGVYAFRVAGINPTSITPFFGKTGAVVMSPEDSTDIDYEADFILAEALVDRYRERFI